eukprot:GEZU01003950.1.p1 GENE.GEZU01003950.1~~GEZU01003950.1.p1  ORF type:complete len:143 (+),score=41.29 GEZU01003950.1:217-645(+)
MAELCHCMHANANMATFLTFRSYSLYTLDKPALYKLFVERITPIVTNVTKENNYVPENIEGFILGEKNLKFKVLSRAQQAFGREIPSYELAKIKTVKDAVTWFVNKIESEKPQPDIRIPPNVKLQIEKIRSQKKAEKREDQE